MKQRREKKCFQISFSLFLSFLSSRGEGAYAYPPPPSRTNNKPLRGARLSPGFSQCGSASRCRRRHRRRRLWRRPISAAVVTVAPLNLLVVLLLLRRRSLSLLSQGPTSQDASFSCRFRVEDETDPELEQQREQEAAAIRSRRRHRCRPRLLLRPLLPRPPENSPRPPSASRRPPRATRPPPASRQTPTAPGGPCP